ncbi:MAG: PEP-CTERM sorting domain-containing protein [Congregibacter sp.]
MAAHIPHALAGTVEHTWHLDRHSVCQQNAHGNCQNNGAVFSADSRYGAYTFESDEGLNTEASGWYEHGQGNPLTNGDEFLKHWSGLSMDLENDEGQPWHGIDNQGPDEFVVFEFDEAVSLQEFNLSYAREARRSGNVTDVTVLYRDSAKAEHGVGALAGADIEDITNTSIGYSVVGHWDAVGQNAPVNFASLTENIFSKVWAIGAYIESLASEGHMFGNPEGDAEGTPNAFKLKSISGVTSMRPPSQAVPAPATFALILVGVLGMSRRRKTP